VGGDVEVVEVPSSRPRRAKVDYAGGQGSYSDSKVRIKWKVDTKQHGHRDGHSGKGKEDAVEVKEGDTNELFDVYETEEDNMTLRQIARGTGVSEEALVALNLDTYPGITVSSKLKKRTTIAVKAKGSGG
jgi:hypothetical protein